VFAAAGSYTVGLAATDDRGLTSTASQTVVIGAGPAAAPVGPIKLFMDGAERCAICVSATQVVRSAARTLRAAVGGEGLAAIRAVRDAPRLKPGPDRLLHAGELFWEQEPLDRAVRTAAERGFQVAQHAIGNEAIDRALTALEHAGGGLFELPGRPRLEHAMMLDEAACRRIAGLGTIAVVQPHFVYDMVGDVAALTPLPPPLALKPLRSLLDAGVTLAGSSDYPVSDFDVMASVRAAVTRGTRGGRVCEPEQAISVEEALRAYTLGSAEALGVDDVAGTLAPGKRADLVVLSGDPRRVDPDRLTDVSVVRTYVAGELAYHPDG
jgi:predicted amidohydrolase YtcJ